MTIMQFKRLPRPERQRVIQAYAMMFAFETYRRQHPGRDLDMAFAHAERTWPLHEDKALDLLSIEMALAEQAIEAT